MANDRWFSRDLPVLDAVVTYFDENFGTFPALADIAEITGMDIEQVAQAARALDGAYIDLQMVMAPPGHWHVKSVFPDARVATGQWPSAEVLATRILAALEQSAEQEPDETKRSRLRDAAAVLSGTAKDVTTNVLTQVILRQTGMG